MLKYILKRIGLAVMILLGVSLIMYILIRCMPMSYVEAKVAVMSTNQEVSQKMVEELYEKYDLADNSFGGIIRGYGKWLLGACRLDFGQSFIDEQLVTEKIVRNMGISFMISFVAVIFEFMIAIPLGITAATHQYSFRDYFVTILVMIGISLPSFFFGQVLKLIFAGGEGAFFAQGGWTNATAVGMNFGEMIVDYIRHAFIPILTVVILSIGARMRMTRTNMLEVMNSDYIRTARAKGLKESKVVYKHAFRNTLIPLVTDLAGLLPALFSGAIITEQVFDLPGIGNVAFKAMQQADIPFIMGYNMFLAMLSVIGVLLADLMYAAVDPRVKLTD